MAKQQKKQENYRKNEQKKIEIGFSLDLNPLASKIILSVLLLLSVILPYYYVSFAMMLNGYNSFPLDDPWIHLTFAKNLAEYGSFSYFKNEIVTSGSTSPLYTFILAAGFFITKNEMWLSYVIGIIFFGLSVFFCYRLANDVFPKENWLAIAAALIFVMDKWLNFIAVTGMETTLFVFLLIACFYYYHRRNAVLFAVTLALTLWTRPDAVAFIAALAADYFFLLYLKSNSPKANEHVTLFPKKDLIKIGAIAGGIAAVYFVMNLVISGSILPNTYSAKLAYYSPDFRNRAEFLKAEVWEYFTESAYLLIFIPFVFGVIKLLKDSFQKKYNRNLGALLFIILLIFIYWYKLPYAHRFGRYLMPVFPFYILLAVYGGREFFTWIGEALKDRKIANALNIILLVSTAAYFGYGYYENRLVYQDQTKYIYIRQVASAKWLKDNTPEGTIVATHDVGAVAFYSERKVIDVVGLINPEFIPKLNTKEFTGFVEEQLRKQNVTYLAFLREWFQVVNQPALFSGGENNIEIMHIFRYEPGKTHILSNEVNSTIIYVGNLLRARQYQQAQNILLKVAAMDPKSSLTFYLLAMAYAQTNDAAAAEKYLKKALELYPDYRDAVFSLTSIYKTQNKLEEARNTVEPYIKIHTNDAEMNKLFVSVQDSNAVKK
jgi:tetratricopeptide (TPR) repeat protein